MSLGGYGGPPADPFGGQQFGGQQFGGGWGGPPPTYQAPPPQQSETNPLATLSIVFAFLFAPAGAALGHIALSQIKRFHQKGRDQAIIGLVLSYLIILVLIVVLIVWLVIPDKSDTSSTADTSTATTSSRPTAPGPTDPKSLERYLLTSEEWTAVLTGDYANIGGTVSGDKTKMYVSEPDTDAPGCSMLLPQDWSSAYKSAEFPSYAYGRWLHEGGVIFSPNDIVVAFATPDAAQEQFKDFSAAWKSCEGRSITERTPDYKDPTAPAKISTYEIPEVTTSDDLVIARTTQTDDGKQQRSTRALGIRNNYLVELDMWWWFDNQPDFGASVGNSAAEQKTKDLVKLIFDKIDKG